MIWCRTAVFAIAAAALLHAAPSLAQSAAPPSRLELGVGALWVGGESLGAVAAAESRGAGGTSTLFNTSTELGSSTGVEGRIAVRVSRAFSAEAAASYMKPQLRIAVSGDVEGAASITATEAIHQFMVGGRVIWRIPAKRWSPRFAPFAMGGAGYLRQLHEAGTLADTGRYYEVGGGVNALLMSRRRWRAKGAGIRADVRAVVRAGGVAFDSGSNASPAAGVSAFVRF